jgi:2-dehydro-3-deoxygluconokinase
MRKPMVRVVTFGEIMGRLEPEGKLRFRQGMPGLMRIGFYGAEANTAVSLQMLGRESAFVTALPDSPIGDACLDSVRRFGVDTRHVIRGEGRLGLYFVEHGADQRPSSVIYDRSNSAFSLAGPGCWNWDRIFDKAGWFHCTGITPSVSREAAEAAVEAVKAAKRLGLTVSCDLNYRRKLWNWEPGTQGRLLAQRTMRDILPYVDLLIANEEDALQMLGIRAGDTDADRGRLSIEAYPEAAERITEEFSHIRKTAFTLRESISAGRNNWGAMLYDADTRKTYFSPVRDGVYTPYRMHGIVDRIGAGDAFAAGLIFALTDDELSKDNRAALDFAAAASCLAHTVHGDFNFSTKEEVLALMGGSGSGRVSR